MKYLGWTITYDHSDKHRVYRLEHETQTCWFGNFYYAILYIREVWERLHFKVGLRYRTINTSKDSYIVITKMDDKFVTYAHVLPNGMSPTTSCPKKDLLKYLYHPHIRLELL